MGKITNQNHLRVMFILSIFLTFSGVVSFVLSKNGNVCRSECLNNVEGIAGYSCTTWLERPSERIACNPLKDLVNNSNSTFDKTLTLPENKPNLTLDSYSTIKDKDEFVSLQERPIILSRLKRQTRERWTEGTYLYRILRTDEGNGLNGITCRNYRRINKPNLNKNDRSVARSIEAHVADNPSDTNWISTSSSLQKQEEMIRGNLQRGRDFNFMVMIDGRLLLKNDVVDLRNERIQRQMLGNNGKAKAYAKVWFEVLVFWEIPREAIVYSRRYTLAPDRRTLRYQETQPNVKPVKSKRGQSPRRI